MNETEVHVLCTTGIRHDIIIKDKTCMTYAVVTKRMHVLTAITVWINIKENRDWILKINK